MHIRQHQQWWKFPLLLAIYPLLLVGLLTIHIVAPQRSGLLAVSQIGSPYLFIPLLALIPWVFYRPARLLRWSLLACGVIFCVRVLPTLVAMPAPAPPDPATNVSVMTWNMLYYNHELQTILEVLNNASADVIALQELSPRQRQAILNDADLLQRYPYATLEPDSGAAGLALLSKFPLIEQGRSRIPNILWARLDLPDGQDLLVVNAHPPSSEIDIHDTLPVVRGYDPSRRDLEIAGVREFISPLLERDERLLLLGDFNVTEWEPAYTELTAGLTDAHRAVGWGLGNTWRGRPHWPLALVRIDYVLGSPRITPLDLHTDCTRYGSDHCVVRGTVAVQ